jgi:hypothetical protein
MVGVGGFGFREEKNGGGAVGCCTAEGEEWGKMGKNDLKNCSRWPKTEYVRTYISAFDRAHAGVCVWVSHAFEHMRAVQCVRKGRCGQTHQGKVERSAVYTFKRIGIRSNVEKFFFFFFLQKK